MADKLGISDFLTIKKMDVFSFIKKCDQQYDYIFAGPPYPLKTIADIPDLILNQNMLRPDGILVLEHNPRVELSNHPQLIDQRNYGQTIFSFFST